MLWWIVGVAVLLGIVRLALSKTGKFAVLLTKAQNNFAIHAWPQSEALYRQALALAAAKSNQARHCQVALARIRYRQAADSFKREWTEEHPRVAVALARLSQALWKAEEPEEARRTAKSALVLFDSNAIPQHPEAEECRKVLA